MDWTLTGFGSYILVIIAHWWYDNDKVAQWWQDIMAHDDDKTWPGGPWDKTLEKSKDTCFTSNNSTGARHSAHARYIWHSMCALSLSHNLQHKTFLFNSKLAKTSSCYIPVSLYHISKALPNSTILSKLNYINIIFIIWAISLQIWQLWGIRNVFDILWTM